MGVERIRDWVKDEFLTMPPVEDVINTTRRCSAGAIGWLLNTGETKIAARFLGITAGCLLVNFYRYNQDGIKNLLLGEIALPGEDLTDFIEIGKI